MEHYRVNQKDILFILKEQLNYGTLCSLDRYKDLNEKALDMVVTEAIKFAQEVLDPLQAIGEKWGVQLKDGKVSCPPEFREAFKQYCENGWLALASDTRYGGQEFPRMMDIVAHDFMDGACQSFAMCPGLTLGAAHLIETFATEEFKERYVPRMLNGQWAGTMALTEPNSGSDLSDIQTVAFREGDNFKIKGTKIFISWGDHDVADNVIHLLLARIEGAPAGTRGISLFIVPKIRVKPDGSLGEANDVICEKVEEKLGIHASPTCELSFGSHDGCIGYLCGQENKGLSHMFQMMNAARIGTGLSGMAIASTAYLNAVAYAKERIQGPDITGQKKGPVPIINHPDIRRMLLWMKAMVDGMRSMIYLGAMWLDLALDSPDKDKKDHYMALVDFMTPIIKAYCSDMGFKVCETAMQCYGGYGFCRDYPIEQYLRDTKILSLYEGTNGIQALDLMGRKMRINEGAPVRAFMEEIGSFCKKNQDHPRLGGAVKELGRMLDKLVEVSTKMGMLAMSDLPQWASNTYPALLSYGDATTCWLLLDMAVAAQKAIEGGKDTPFYQSKVTQALYFTRVTLPMAMARLDSCAREGREVVEMPAECF
jgi:alkylation response protein AidB-like acyl-CoA dehydrogenase